jgi:outer membrane cobalamin receptor
MRLCLVLAALALTALPAGAQQGAALEGELPDSIVITASRYPEDVRYAGRRLAIWTAREIERLPVASVDDLLRTVAGVDVQSRGGFGVQSDFSIRGSGFNGVLLLLDGAPINDPMTGHFLADLPVPLSEIARVEVLRGPAAAVYGPDALGGVIQLFTYAGLSQEGGDAPARVEGSLRGGAHSLYDADVSASGGDGGLFLDAASAWQGTDGEPITGARVRTDFRRRVHTGAASARVGRAAVFTRVGWDERTFGAFHFYTPFPSDTARESTSTLWAQARVRTGAWTAHVHAKQHFDRYVYNPVTPANEHTSRMLNAHVVRRWTPSSAVTTTAGFEGGVRGIDSNNLGVHGDASGGLFAAAHWRRGAVAIRGAGRTDYDPAYGLEATPQLFGSLEAGRLVFHAGAARAVRAPNYIERYFNTTLSSPRGGNLGNPELEPERAWSLEAGASLYAAPGVRMHLTGFRRVTHDLIDYAMTSPEDTVFLARNLHRVRTVGLEAELEARRSWSGFEGAFTTSYSLLDADIGQVDDDVSFKYALAHARHLLQSTLTVRRGRITVGGRGLYKDPIDGESYLVAHLRAGFVPPLASGRLTLEGELRNVFDATYTDIFDAPMPGRWWLAGLRWRP